MSVLERRTGTGLNPPNRIILGFDPATHEPLPIAWMEATQPEVYGKALKAGHITPAEFLDINHKVGGWKQPKEMVQEVFPFFPGITPAMNRAPMDTPPPAASE